MAVSARSVNSLIGSASTFGPAAEQTPVLAGTYCAEVGAEVVTGWHSHDLHQLEYAFEGIAEVETETARYLLPPQQAVWIPAGVEHSSTLTHVKAVSVFFDPAMGLPAGDRVRVLAAAPVIREMILHARRWPISRGSSDAETDVFFAALANLIVEWLDHETPLCLPTGRDPLVQAAMKYTTDRLSDVTLGEVCRAIGASERTLRRAFFADTGLSWRQYLQSARLMKAVALLAEGNQNLLSIALSVGFESASAFTRAFGRYTGESPIAYRRRVRATPDLAVPTVEPQQMRTTLHRWSHWQPETHPGLVPSPR